MRLSFAWFGLVLVGLWGLALACTPDELACKETKDCNSKSLVCLSGRCVKPRCSVDDQCAFNEYCDTRTSECRRKDGPGYSCRTSQDCRTGELCVAGFCQLKGSEEKSPPPDRDPNVCDPACEVGHRCEQGSCQKLPEDKACKFDQDCEGGLKCNLLLDRCQKPCTADGDCSDGRVCKQEFCQFPEASPCDDTTNPCPSGQVCKDGKCSTPPAPECGPQKACPAPKVCKDGKCIDEAECGPQKACPSPKVCKDGKCVDSTPSTCGPNQPCPSGSKCWKGTCAPEDYCEANSDCNNGQTCTRNKCGGCTKDSDCPTHQSCVSGTCDFVKKKFGEECIDSSQCVTGGICMGDGSGKQYCRQKCDPSAPGTGSGCPATHGCSLLSDQKSGACVPKKGAGALTAGKTCNPNNVQCEVDLVCVNNGGSHICMQLCHTQKQNCPSGKCVSVNIDPIGVCDSGGSGGKGENASCKAQSECKSGLLCLQVSPGQGRCKPSCDLYKPACSPGDVCDIIANYSSRSVTTGVCGPVIQGVGEGQLCDYNAHSAGSCPPTKPRCLCRSDFFCFLNKANPTNSLCARPCDPTTKICPAGMQCVPSPLQYKGSNLWGCI